MEQEYQEATGVFDRTRRDLQTHIGILPKKEYARLSRSAEQAWEALQKVHAALDKHLRQHACMT